ncbi:MAG: hypothetical protein FJ098_15315 [Deltaproteobacteria bacterium]|nr:hypothetical protein [Deltaproteobacteria bacterium]
MPPDLDVVGLLVALADAKVEFIVVGGVAAVAQGVPLSTFDLDIVHHRTPGNIERLRAFFDVVSARARHRPEGQRILPGADALAGPGHQLLLTDRGPLDVLGAIEDGADYVSLLPDSVEHVVRGRGIRFVGLSRLAELKRGSTRAKDKLALLLIEETLARRGG